MLQLQCDCLASQQHQWSIMLGEKDPQGNNTKELVKKIEKGEVYVDIKTEDKPKGKVRGKN